MMKQVIARLGHIFWGIVISFLVSLPLSAAETLICQAKEKNPSVFQGFLTIAVEKTDKEIRVLTESGADWTYKVVFTSTISLRALRVSSADVELPSDDLIASILGGELFIYNSEGNTTLLATGVNAASEEVDYAAYACQKRTT